MRGPCLFADLFSLRYRGGGGGEGFTDFVFLAEQSGGFGSPPSSDDAFQRQTLSTLLLAHPSRFFTTQNEDK